MSTTSKVFFLASCAITATIIYKVHHDQEEERTVSLTINLSKKKKNKM